MKKLILIYSLFVFKAAIAQNNNSITIGQITNTSAGKQAIQLLMNYTKEDLIPSLNTFKVGENSIFRFSPEINFQSGGEDAFNGSNVKFYGNWMKFKLTKIDGIDSVPDLGDFFHNVAFGGGLETNKDFSSTNGLLEIGYIPWYSNMRKLKGNTLGKILASTKLGVFIQTGYKFKSPNDSILNANNIKIGNLDQSKEKQDNGLFRLKAQFKFSPKQKINQDLAIGIRGQATFWYDAINNANYQRIDGAFVIYYNKLTIDTKYEKGSNAPNFNQGEQFSTNLSITF